MTLKIEPSKVYMTRAGDLVKIRSTTIDDRDCPVLGLYLSGRNKNKLGTWQADGSISVYATNENDKLVSEWTNALQYQTKYSAGLDLCTVVGITLPPLCRAIVDTGVYLRDVIPDTMAVNIRYSTDRPAGLQFSDLPFAMVCSRSGLAANCGVTVLNAPGIIDADYEETIKVILYNTNPTRSVHIRQGERIAQLVFAYAYRRTELVRDEQRTGGLGSTGTGETLSGSTGTGEPPYK